MFKARTKSTKKIYDLVRFYIFNDKNVKGDLLNVALYSVDISEIVNNYNDFMVECEKELKEGVKNESI